MGTAVWYGDSAVGGVTTTTQGTGPTESEAPTTTTTPLPTTTTLPSVSSVLNPQQSTSQYQSRFG